MTRGGAAERIMCARLTTPDPQVKPIAEGRREAAFFVRVGDLRI
jgi:hypothetical protein